MKYNEAAELFATARVPANGKPIANNTRLYQVWAHRYKGPSEICYEIRLHENTIITIFPDNIKWLSSSGWRTVTTKDRLNRFAFSTQIDYGTWSINRYTLFQRNWKWIIRDRVTDEESPFFDGMLWTKDAGLSHDLQTLNYPRGG